MRPDNSCKNESCPKFNVPTRLMGGCECGQPLTPVRVGPTMEQMENLAVVMGFGSLLLLPEKQKKDGLERLHALVQSAANGDREANQKLAFLQRIFA